MAAAVALADLTEQPVPEEVKSAFPADKDFSFGPNYIVPTPFDPRLLKAVAVATAKGIFIFNCPFRGNERFLHQTNSISAACESGVAKKPISDWAAYESKLDTL